MRVQDCRLFFQKREKNLCHLQAVDRFFSENPSRSVAWHNRARMKIDFDRLWRHVAESFLLPAISIHGPAHWRRVERNGLVLSARTGADPTLVRLFAVFHDSRREDDGWDVDHGRRGAEFAASLRGELFDLPDADFALLQEACISHTSGRHHSDLTIGTCWDADRLDLGRVGVIPSPEYMSTDFGREIADFGTIWPYLKEAPEVNEG